MKKVFFVGANKLLISFINSTVDVYETVVQTKTPFSELDTKITFIQCDLIDFGLSKLFKFFHLETSSPFLYKGLTQNLQKHRPDKIVHFDIIRFAIVQVMRYVKQNPECQLYLYCETKKWPRNPLSRVLLWVLVLYVRRNQKYITKIIVYTDQGHEWFTKQFSQTTIALCPVPVDQTLFFPSPVKTYLPNKTLRIIINARFVSFKRHKDLFQALVYLQNKGLSFTCTCIGTGGHLKSVLEQDAQVLGLSSSVKFFDAVPVEEVREIYWNNDVLVLPSKSEPIGWVVPEAMACGLTTITSDTVGANVYVRNNITSYIHTTKDSFDLAKKIEQLYDASLLERLSQEASKHIQSQYTTALCNQRFLGIIK